LKLIELRVLSELMKDSKRADRELAKLLGVSQPTVSRIRPGLEKRSCIKEYTTIPDFKKLGYEILAITLVKLKKLSREQTERTRKMTLGIMEKAPFEIIMAEREMGLEYAVVISYHKDYSDYLGLLQWLRKSEVMQVSEINSYIISLADLVRYRPLTFRTLAQHISTLKSEKKDSQLKKSRSVLSAEQDRINDKSEF